jgi:hypothetical protein
METPRKRHGTAKMDKMETGVVRAVVLAVLHCNLWMKKRNWTTAGIVPVANRRESVGERRRALHRTRTGEAEVPEWQRLDPKTNVLLG